MSPSNALTQQMQEVETPAQKPTSALGNGLLGDMGEDDRKLNPIVSTLTKEHPKNPVRLQGGLLGEPSQLQRPVKPTDPFSELGDLPKLRKLWTARRIDSEKRAMHDNWARLINSMQDFGGIIPTFKRHIETNGKDGRADVADMIGRVSQNNPDHARFFQRELATALGGETIQARLAGEPVDKTGLLGEAKSNRFSDPDFEKSYWRSAEAYKAEFEKRQREAMKAADEPRKSQPEEAYPPTTEPPNDHNQSSHKSGKPIVNLKDDRIANIKSDKPAVFEIEENPVADGTAPFYRDHKKGSHAVSAYGAIIEKEARRQGVDPDLVKSIMYMENADGHKYGLNDLADKIGVSKSVMPMNIRPDVWGELGLTRQQAEMPEENIRASVVLIRRIQERVDNPTPEKVGTLWNNFSKEKINDIGARVGAIYRGRSWEKR